MRMLTNSISTGCGTTIATARRTTSRRRRFFRRALAIDPYYPQAIAALAIAVCNSAYLGWAENAEGNYVDASSSRSARSLSMPGIRTPVSRSPRFGMWTHRSDRADGLSFRRRSNLTRALPPPMSSSDRCTFTAAGRRRPSSWRKQGFALSPSDPRLFIWLPALAGAHYQLRHYDQAVEIGRRSWTLNRNWPAGLRYVVAGLAQLGQVDEAQAPIDELKRLNANLAFVEGNLRRLFTDRAGVDHILDGLRKAGLE